MDKAEKIEEYTKKVNRYLSYRPRSRQEVVRYLKKKNCPEELIDEIIEKFIKEDLLDDSRFVDWWIDQRLTFKPRGKRGLRNELFKKGINRQLIDKKLAQIDRDQLISGARKVIKQRIDGWQDLDFLGKKKKISDYLGRRGFRWEIVSMIIDEFLQKE